MILLPRFDFLISLMSGIMIRSLSRLLSRNILTQSQSMFRRYAAAAAPIQGQTKDVPKKGIVIGIFTDPKIEEASGFKFTKNGSTYNNKIGGKIEGILSNSLEHLPRLGKAMVLQNVDPEYQAVAVVGLGKEEVGLNTLEHLDECRENIRIAAGIGARKLYEMDVTEISVEGFGQTEAAAEGAALAVWKYDDHKDKEDRKPPPKLELAIDDDKESWDRGIFKAEVQNFVRHVCETPANYMTPAIFTRIVEDFLCPCAGVNVDIRSEEYILKQGMHAFLHVAKSSEHKPMMIELHYCGGKEDERPFVFLGKGVTYDTGSLFLKKCEEMAEHRGDIAGGAIVVAIIRALATFQLPINAYGIIPLCENALSGKSIRPGDVVFTCKNTSIQITNPDHEDRVILADVMHYLWKFDPRLLVTIATLTPGIRSALGAAASGVFTNNFTLWQEARKAGTITGDRVWRLPLWDTFTSKLTKLTNADISNMGTIPSKGACFLKTFVPPCCEWIHFDITAVALRCDGKEHTYYTTGLMMGRPTRTIIQFVYQLSCPPDGKPILEDTCVKECDPKEASAK